MRSEIGHLDLDSAFVERDSLNAKMRLTLNDAS